MVGIGSGDTYAATTCTCPSGYTKNGTNCTKVVYKDQGTTCCLGGNCSGSGHSTCTSGVQCGSTKTESGATLCQNPKIPNTETIAATCTTTVTCSEGEYHVGQGHCDTCPAGSWCPGGTFNYGDQNVGMNKCPDGTISSAGKSSKSDCVSTSQTTCPAGQYYLDSSKNCTSCEAGNYCPGVTADKSKLEDQGIYPCPAHATCTSSSFTCDSASGYDKNSAGTGCEKDTTGTGKQTCPPGQYYLDSSKNCTSCEAGNYCPGVTADKSKLEDQGIYPCPAHATCTSSSFTCDSASGYDKNSAGTGCDKDTTSGGGNGGSGGGNTGGNGGNTGGNGGNTGGYGSNDDNSDVNNNPNTATKTPLAIAIIGMLAIGVGTVTYYKGKNNEI